MKIINNRKKKRHLPGGLWIKSGTMFPWVKRKFVHIGLFGIILCFHFGSFE